MCSCRSLCRGRTIDIKKKQGRACSFIYPCFFDWLWYCSKQWAARYTLQNERPENEKGRVTLFWHQKRNFWPERPWSLFSSRYEMPTRNVNHCGTLPCGLTRNNSCQCPFPLSEERAGKGNVPQSARMGIERLIDARWVQQLIRWFWSKGYRTAAEQRIHSLFPN